MYCIIFLLKVALLLFLVESEVGSVKIAFRSNGRILGLFQWLKKTVSEMALKTKLTEFQEE